MNRVSVIILTLSLCFSLALRGDEKEEDPQVDEIRDWKAIAITIGAVALLTVGGYKFSKFLRKGANSYYNVVDAAGLKHFFDEGQADDITQWFADGSVRESYEAGYFYFTEIMTAAGRKGRSDIMDRVVEISIEKDFEIHPYDLSYMLSEAVKNNQIKAVNSLIKVNIVDNFDFGENIDIAAQIETSWRNNNIEIAEALVNYAIKRGMKYKYFASDVLTRVDKPAVTTGTAFEHYLTTGIKFAHQESIGPGEHLASVLTRWYDKKDFMDAARVVVKLATEYDADHTKICRLLLKERPHDERFFSFKEQYLFGKVEKFIEAARERGVHIEKSEMSTALEDALQHAAEDGSFSLINTLFKTVQATGIDIDKDIAQEVLEQAMHREEDPGMFDVLLRALGSLREHYDRYFGAGAYDRKFSRSYHGYSRPTVADTGMSNKRAYEVLGLDRNASFEEVKKAFRTLIKKWYPTRNPSEEAPKRTGEILTAWDTLRKQLEPNLKAKKPCASPCRVLRGPL